MEWAKFCVLENYLSMIMIMDIAIFTASGCLLSKHIASILQRSA